MGNRACSRICPILPKRKAASYINIPSESPSLGCPNSCANSQDKLAGSSPTNLEFIDFPFLNDDKIFRWIVNTRFMIIMRGPPGSGKSYVANLICKKFQMACVCSADFCSQNLSDSNLSQELACQAQVDRALQEGCSPVIVDNTNIQAWEFRTYIEMARKADYIVMLVTPQTPWRFDTSECAARNCHDVSLDVCESKIRRFESVYPLYYAWFWPGRQSAHASANSGLAAYPVDEASRLLSWAWNTFDELLRLPIFQEDFRRLFELSSEANLDQLARCWRPTVDTIPSSEDSYMKHANFKSKLIHSAPTLTTRLHVTTHFSRFGREPGSLDYAHSGPVERALLGQLTTAKVTSILVTCRTICVKVSLNGLNDGGSNDTSKESTLERLLWMSDDQEVVNRSLDPESRHQARPINSSGGRCAQSK